MGYLEQPGKLAGGHLRIFILGDVIDLQVETCDNTFVKMLMHGRRAAAGRIEDVLKSKGDGR
jgi:hypothetical protein